MCSFPQVNVDGTYASSFLVAVIRSAVLLGFRLRVLLPTTLLDAGTTALDEEYTAGSPLPLDPNSVRASGRVVGDKLLLWSHWLEHSRGLRGATGWKILEVRQFTAVCSLKSCKWAEVESLSLGRASTQAGRLFCSNLSMHIVHFEAVAVGESESNTIAPYGQALSASLRLKLLASSGSIGTAPYFASLNIAPFAAGMQTGF